MKYEELKAAFEAYTAVIGEVDDAELATWMNEAQLDLALDFGRVTTVELVPDENGVAAPPPDSIKVIDAAEGYAWDGAGQMVFGLSGPVKVTYRAMPAPEHVLTGSDPEQTPDLPFAIHYLLAIFAAAMYWYRESEGDAEEMALAREWMSRYHMAKKMFLSKMDRAGSSNVDRWTVVDD